MAVSTKCGLILALLVSSVVVSLQQTTEDPANLVCNRTLDLMFVIDGSNSIGADLFSRAMDTISRAVDVLVVDANNARVGAALYSKEISGVLGLQTDKVAFQNAVRNFEYPDESTFTNLGINKAAEILLAEQRNNTPMTIMILTDGDASDQSAAFYAALEAQSKGIDMWAIGIGNDIDMDEVARYATNGSQQTFKIDSYQILADRLLNLTRLVCINTDTRPTFTFTTTVTTVSTESTTAPTATTTNATSFANTTSSDNTTSSVDTTSSTNTTPITNTTPSTNTTASTNTTPSTNTTISTNTTSSTNTTPSTNTSSENTTTSANTTSFVNTTSSPVPSTTPTSVNPMPNSTQSPGMNDTDKYTELCRNSLTVGGVGYVLYPGDCSKVLQCYYNPNTNKTLVVTRQCPSGQFWDQTCLKCADSWKVDCPYDQCKSNSCSEGCARVDTYPMSGICGGFWSCQNGRSYPKCCPPCYSYMAGYGCKFGTTCFDKCGPQEECPEGLGVCEKIPTWDNSTVYAVASDAQGLQQTTCLHSDFSIVGCKCHLKFMDIFMQSGQECLPYHEVNSSMECSGAAQSVPIKQQSSAGSLAFRINLNVSTPYFDITSSPNSSQCDNPAKLRVWADAEGIHASLGDTTRGGVYTTVLFQNVTGQLEITVLLRQSLLTLGVSRDKVQYVSTVKARSNTLCTACIHNFSVRSTSKDDCLVHKVALYNCQPEITNIYVRS